MSNGSHKSIEEFSNTPSEAETTSEIPDSDAEKFPALFGVPQMLKSAPEEARLQLVEAVGYFFLGQWENNFCDPFYIYIFIFCYFSARMLW